MPSLSQLPPVPTFEGSRRLTGPNLYFTQGGAVLQTLMPVDAVLQARWQAHVAQARQRDRDEPSTVGTRAGDFSIAGKYRDVPLVPADDGSGLGL